MKKIENYFWDEKKVLLEKENNALKRQENLVAKKQSFLKIHVILSPKDNELRVHFRRKV